MIKPEELGLGRGKNKVVELVTERLNQGVPVLEVSALNVTETAARQFVSSEDKYEWSNKPGEAPLDGVMYARINGEWVFVPDAATLVSNHEAKVDPHSQYLTKQSATDDYLTKTQADSDFLKTSTLGQPSGVATLDSAGTIPTTMLPTLATARKVNVADFNERLALSIYPDLTIAYESDTGQAYALDANEDPSVSSNWSQLGNAQAVGVSSFNSRTGSVTSQQGDYSTSQITEDGVKLFASPAEKLAWNEKETPSGAQAKADSVKSYADATFVTKESSATKEAAQDNLISQNTSKNALQDVQISDLKTGKADLVAGKVPFEQLPDLPVGRKVTVADKAARLALPVHPDLTIAYEIDTADAWGLNANVSPAVEANWSKLGNAQVTGVQSFNGRTGSIGPQTGDYITNQITETVDKMFLTPALKSEWDSKETTSGSQAKANTARDFAVALSKTYADDTFLAKSSRAVANGVAPLGADGRVPVANLPVPKNNRTWRDRTGIRSAGVWYTNDTTSDLELHIMSDNVNNGSYFTVTMRSAVGANTIDFIGNSTSLTVDGPNTRVFINVSVPVGWQYQLSSATLNTRQIAKWYEMVDTF